MISDICAKCNLCTFMPEQERRRVLRCWWGVRSDEEVDREKVLVIDNCDDKRDMMRACDIARDLVQGPHFTYTTTIRCDFMPGELNAEQINQAEQRCAVWTHQLLENRMLIISTQSGLRQMQVGEGRREGDLWRNSRLGVILCIPPLLRMAPSTMGSYQHKIERVLKDREVA